MPVLYVITGLPGAGKSTLARKLCPEDRCFSTNDLFMVNGEYRFNPVMLGINHRKCLMAVIAAMRDGTGQDVAVDNTFTEHWERLPYFRAAKAEGYLVQVIEVHGPWKSLHNVPDHAINRMRKRYQPHASQA